MEPSVSPEREKLALEIKFLVGLSSTYKEEATLVALNKLYPFTQFPLHKVPPVEFLEYAVEEIISQNIKEELQSYCFVVVVGKIRL